MRYFTIFAALLFLLVSCNNELAFEEKSFYKKTSLPCKENCPHISVKIPVAVNVPIVADSINKKVFATMKEIIYVGEKPFAATDYNGLLTAFINSYNEMQEKYPKDNFRWEGEITGNIKYQSENILDIEIKHYTDTGGNHGYSGKRSLIFNPETGKSIPNENLFKDINAFKAFAEKKFRAAYRLKANDPINASGLAFEDDVFQLPQTYFFTDKGLLLYYNVYEIASYSDGPKELLIPYTEVSPYLAAK